jgi:hypothetical protein
MLHVHVGSPPRLTGVFGWGASGRRLSLKVFNVLTTGQLASTSMSDLTHSVPTLEYKPIMLASLTGLLVEVPWWDSNF